MDQKMIDVLLSKEGHNLADFRNLIGEMSSTLE